MNTKKSPEEIEAERENMSRLYVSIGQFIFEFSQLEFMIRHLLGEALGSTARRDFLLLYLRTTSSHYAE